MIRIKQTYDYKRNTRITNINYVPISSIPQTKLLVVVVVVFKTDAQNVSRNEVKHDGGKRERRRANDTNIQNCVRTLLMPLKNDYSESTC